MHTSKDQEERRRQFVRKHRYLVRTVSHFMNSVGHPYTRCHTWGNGALLVRLAREELDYSDKTWGLDILRFLSETWGDVEKEFIVPRETITSNETP